MARTVYAWPPVGAVGSLWTEVAPVLSSRSMITGADYDSRWERARIEAVVNVSALSRSRSGAGYSEVLKKLLDGGVNLVRLNSYPINWHLDALELDPLRRSERMAWTSAGDPLDWQATQQPLAWFTGAILRGVASADGQIVVTGLPPDRLVCRPADFVRAFPDLASDDGIVAQAITEAYSDADGVATIRLIEPLPEGSYLRVNIGDSDSRVFKAEGMPRAVQGVGANWSYQWQFREAFADEVGGFVEVNPW